MESTKQKDNIWRPISALRKIEENLSGKYYSYEWVKSSGFIDHIDAESWGGKIHTAHVVEPIKIRLGEGNIIEYRKVETDDESQGCVFETKFGRFHSENRGEFGGKLRLPSGDCIGGNFDWVFDYNDNVYAIDSICHMGIGHFKFYEFHNSNTYRCIYDVGIWGERNNERFTFRSMYASPEGIYILLDGEVIVSDGSHKFISRLLFFSNGTVEECIDFEEIFTVVTSIIVLDSALYIAADKVLAVIDIKSGAMQFYTFIKKSAENDILNTIKNESMEILRRNKK